MRRAQRVLLVAFALSLVLHAVVALVLRPATADFQTQPEAVSVVRRSTMIVARHTPPPPRRTQTPSPRNLAPPRPRASGAAVARSEGGSGGRRHPAPARYSGGGPRRPHQRRRTRFGYARRAGRSERRQRRTEHRQLVARPRRGLDGARRSIQRAVARL